jgi:predicted amidohydrolase YtcJ
LDAYDSTVLPGLIDSHCHLSELGALPRSVDLRGTNSLTSIRLRLFGRIQKTLPGEWIVGRGWDQEAFVERRFPTRDDIDDVTSQNPAILVRNCEHVGLLNSGALALLGISESTPNPPGGLYSRDANGRLDGLVWETALTAVLTQLPGRAAAHTEEDLLRGEYEAAKNGITTVHCILSERYLNEIAAFESLRDAGRLSLRYRLYVPISALDFLRTSGVVSHLNDDMIRVNGTKLFADGSLGARTAALNLPYSDDPGNVGILRYSDEQLRDLITASDALGLQTAVHAIGDRAISQVLDAIDDSGIAARERRPRIEHASLTPEELLSRMQKKGVSAAVQPHFVVSDSWAEERLGRERVGDLYAFRSMLAKGIAASGGSDAPTEPLSALIGIWAAASGTGARANQSIGVDEAVELYTVKAAWNGFDEGALGSIRVGGRADLTVLDSNLAGIHPALVRRVGIAATIVDGRFVYSYEGIG